MKKRIAIRTNVLFLFWVCIVGSAVAQTNLYVHYVDKSFDANKTAFVKNELIIANDSVSYIENRYKTDFSDSVAQRMMYMPVNAKSKAALIELLNSYVAANNVFGTKFQSLKFDKNQTLFARRFHIRLNATDYYLYDLPDENATIPEEIKTDRAKFEKIMKAIEACMRP